MQLTNVDVQAQCFDVQFAIEATFVNGAKDTDLRREGCEFPLDADGRPTFRPSAGWFLSKMDFNNALSHELIESSVKVNNDNLDTILYIKGTFFESLELYDFPFDTQPLHISLCINCRKDGPLPISFKCSHSKMVAIIKPTGFFLHQIWRLHESVDVTCGFDGASAERMFPTLIIAPCITRRSGFFVINVAFLILETVDRLSVSLAMLLTIAAYKQSMTSITPAISYLTLLDRYVVFSAGLVMLVTVEGAFAAFALRFLLDPCGTETPDEAPGAANVSASAWKGVINLNALDRDACLEFPISELDVLFCIINGVLWALLHLHVGWRVLLIQRRSSELYGRTFDMHEHMNSYFESEKNDARVLRSATRARRKMMRCGSSGTSDADEAPPSSAEMTGFRQASRASDA